MLLRYVYIIRYLRQPDTRVGHLLWSFPQESSKTRPEIGIQSHNATLQPCLNNSMKQATHYLKFHSMVMGTFYDS